MELIQLTLTLTKASTNVFILVHNGVIENFQELKDRFFKDVELVSETDTEVIVQLVQVYSDRGLNTKEAFKKSCIKTSRFLCTLFNRYGR